MRSTRALHSSLSASLLLLAAGASGCSENALPEGHHLARVKFPLLVNFQDDARELLEQREREDHAKTELTDDVDWAETLDEAFERAKREDKPVMIATFVRENGDPACDL